MGDIHIGSGKAKQQEDASVSQLGNADIFKSLACLVPKSFSFVNLKSSKNKLKETLLIFGY